VTQISELSGINPETNRVIVTDIYNMRDGKELRPTGYLPSFVASLVEKGLLDLEYLYGEQAPAIASNGAAQLPRQPSRPALRQPI